MVRTWYWDYSNFPHLFSPNFHISSKLVNTRIHGNSRSETKHGHFSLLNICRLLRTRAVGVCRTVLTILTYNLLIILGLKLLSHEPFNLFPDHFGREAMKKIQKERDEVQAVDRTSRAVSPQLLAMPLLYIRAATCTLTQV